jgi:2-polyprenyl-3-methyl-5-hydroxy-6-metoxy-1,4-benzoquinol methylase
MTTQQNALEKTQHFWQDFYAKQNNISQPSPFVCWVLAHYLQQPKKIFEIGCGNGRDSFAFAQQGHQVLAIDACEVAIGKNKTQCDVQNGQNIQFHALELSQLTTLSQEISTTDILYSRFVLHAIPESLEDMVLSCAMQNLPAGAMMIHEFRTNKDPLMNQGEMISVNERMTDHYRRFIDSQTFRNKLLLLGWEIVYFEESNGLAVFGDEDPVVARCVFKKSE